MIAMLCRRAFQPLRILGTSWTAGRPFLEGLQNRFTRGHEKEEFSKFIKLMTSSGVFTARNFESLLAVSTIWLTGG